MNIVFLCMYIHNVQSLLANWKSLACLDDIIPIDVSMDLMLERP